MSKQHEARKQALYEAPVIPLVPGVRETLQQLEDAGHLLSTGSSNNTDRQRLGLAKTDLLHFFDPRIYGPDLTNNLKKPDPAVFNFGIAAHGIPPEQTVVIEDTEPGVIAGRAAGAHVIAYLDPRFGGKSRQKAESFRQAGADTIVTDFRKIFNVAAALSALPVAARSRKPAAPRRGVG